MLWGDLCTALGGLKDPRALLQWSPGELTGAPVTLPSIEEPLPSTSPRDSLNCRMFSGRNYDAAIQSERISRTKSDINENSFPVTKRFNMFLVNKKKVFKRRHEKKEKSH